MSVKIMAFCVLWLVAAGFATGHVSAENEKAIDAKVSEGTEEKHSTFGREVRAEIRPMLSGEVAKPALGIKPWHFQLFPVFMKVENLSPHPVKVKIVNSCLRVDGKQYDSIPVEVVLGRIGLYDASAALGLAGMFWGFGGVGVLVGAAAGLAMDKSKVTSRSVEEHYHDQKFKPTILPPGRQGSGIVFFDFPVSRVFADEFVFFVEVANLNGNETRMIEVHVPVSASAPLTEKEK
jgi:hypothetical protein